MDKERELHNLIYLLRKQFFTGLATTNDCSSEDCTERVRDTGHCARCLVIDIENLVFDNYGDAPALYDALERQHEAITRLTKSIEDK